MQQGTALDEQRLNLLLMERQQYLWNERCCNVERQILGLPFYAAFLRIVNEGAYNPVEQGSRGRNTQGAVWQDTDRMFSRPMTDGQRRIVKISRTGTDHNGIDLGAEFVYHAYRSRA